MHDMQTTPFTVQQEAKDNCCRLYCVCVHTLNVTAANYLFICNVQHLTVENQKAVRADISTLS
jgi:hypothetical protein